MLDKILDKFEWLKKVKLVELNEIDTLKIPRPELDNWFRNSMVENLWFKRR